MEAFRDQLRLSPCSPYLFPSGENPSGHQKTLKTVWHATLRRAGIPYFRIYDLRSTYATRLSAGGVADEWVTQLLRQGDAKVFKKYSQMKLQMKREALLKLNRQANCQRQWKAEPFSPEKAGASEPPERAPVGGDAVRTLQQILNCLARMNLFHV